MKVNTAHLKNHVPVCGLLSNSSALLVQFLVEVCFAFVNAKSTTFTFIHVIYWQESLLGDFEGTSDDR